MPTINESIQSPVSNVPSTAFDDRSAFTAAYERRLAEIQGVPDEQLAPVNIDMDSAVMTVLGTLPEVTALRPKMTGIPGLDLQRIDALEDYAQATAEASSRYVTAITPLEDIKALNDEALKLRETIRTDATALAHRGLVDPARLAPFKGTIGFKNVAFELVDWANLMRDCWGAIQGKTALTAEEIQHAKDVGERLVRAAGVREQAPETVGEAAKIRLQAFTLLVKAYDEARRAVSFLRWHEDDVDTLAPSLYAGHGGRGKPAAKPAEPPAAPEAASPSAPTPAAPAETHPPVAPGLPGASPFVTAPAAR